MKSIGCEVLRVGNGGEKVCEIPVGWRAECGSSSFGGIPLWWCGGALLLLFLSSRLKYEVMSGRRMMLQFTIMRHFT